MQVANSGSAASTIFPRELSEQLNLNAGQDATLVEQKLKAAVAYTVALCGEVATPIPAPVREAVLMLAAHLYENREAATLGNGSISTVPLGYDELILPYRAWAF